MTKRALFVIVSLHIVWISFAFAHHGKKYLVTSDYELPRPGSWHFLLSTDTRNRFGAPSVEFEPGLLLGVTRHISLEVHTHHAFEAGEFHTEAIAAESRIGILGNVSAHEDEERMEGSPFGMALLVEFEKGLGNHGDNVEGRIILGGDVSSFSLAANFIWQQSLTREPREIKYALGVKRELLSFLAIGTEVEGSFSERKTPRLTPGVYLTAGEKFDIKLGATVRTDSQEGILRLALVYGL